MTNLTKKLLILIATFALAALALTACGDDDESPSTTAAESTSEETSSGGGETVSFEADPDGALAYTETAVTAAAGEATIAFDNPSSTAHNVVIEDEGGSAIAETETITGDSTTAAATLEPGTFTFYCSVDSHREAGMEGELTVE